MFTLDTDRRPLLDYADDLERQAEQQPQQAKEAAGDTPPRKPG